MARTDKRGRSLKTFLIAEITGQDITVEEIREAVGIKRTRWYGDADNPGRAVAEDFPDAMELRSLAQYFNLGENGWVNLMVEFDWLQPRLDAPGFTNPLPDGVTITKTDWHHIGPAV